LERARSAEAQGAALHLDSDPIHFTGHVMNAPLASSSNPASGMAPTRGTSPALLVGAGLAAGVFAAAAGALVWQKVSTPAVLPASEPAASAVVLPASAAASIASVASAPVVAQAASPVAPPVPVHKPVHKPVSQTHTPAAVAETPSAPVTTVQAPPAPPVKAVCTNCGVVESVQEEKHKGHGTGMGAVAGGVVGGVVGNQFGKNSRIIGAIGGALLGHQIERDVRSTVDYRISVRMEDGSRQTVTQAQSVPVGTHVTVQNGVLRVNNGAADSSSGSY